MAKKVKKFGTPQLIMLVQEMKSSAYQWESLNVGQRCEGLAAPQIGYSLRVIIIRKSDNKIPEKGTDEFKKWQETASFYDPWYVMINPVFVRSSGDPTILPEECMSIPNTIGKSVRPGIVEFYYFDLDGKRVPPRESGNLTAKGISARVISHEIEHLNGCLFIDQNLNVQLKSLPTAKNNEVAENETTGLNPGI